MNLVTLSLLVLFCFSPGYGKEPWCYNKTINFSQQIEIRSKFCRLVTVRARPLGQPFSLTPRLKIDASDRPPHIENEEKAAQDVMKAYPGLFLKETTAKKMSIKKNRFITDKQGRFIPAGLKPGRPIRPGLMHDGDLHCPTFQELEKAPESMTSISGEKKFIVHFDSVQVYQYIQKGTCGGSSTQRCSGSCLQEKSISYLMAWKDDDPSWPMGFEPFEIDTYCSCKNISPVLSPLISRIGKFPGKIGIY